MDVLFNTKFNIILGNVRETGDLLALGVMVRGEEFLPRYEWDHSLSLSKPARVLGCRDSKGQIGH